MSFSSDVKQEITHQEYNLEQKRALLSAFMHLNASMQIVNRVIMLKIELDNAATARFIMTLVKELYHAEVELTVLRRSNLDKRNIYRLLVTEQAMSILEDLGIYSSKGLRPVPYNIIVVKEANARAYLAGAFLAGGSVNAPNTANYHAEIRCNNEEMAEFIQKILGRFELNAKSMLRRNKPVVYIKAADHIADFLKIVYAHESTMEFEDVRIQRDFKNSLTRLDNCEVANEMKSIKAGSAQLDAIYTLIKNNRYNYIDQKLIEVGDLRMDMPEASLNELIEEYQDRTGNKISKSGLQHRFNKIIELAQKFDDNK
ncbi:DNA-binding protein WhiA [Erysipelothrix larvae]|uniref:Probable cell division protein WhiA n=1 Tax=Erysipelothrix larvae TaxID=1514105 RepID=A0A109UGG8_9FIRM|nr:DNA-binding protein WhiA [Erysipelothrix larvae]AMC92548.1 DNA-binding protein WhiA [Erysipelothrix larvae]